MRELTNVNIFDAVIFSISYFLVGIILQFILFYLYKATHNNKKCSKCFGIFEINEIASWAVLWPLLLLLVISELDRKFRRKNSPPLLCRLVATLVESVGSTLRTPRITDA